MNAPAGRPRTARRAIAKAQRAPVAGRSRERMAAALACCSDAERHILALLIEERMSAAETALALELPIAHVVRVQSTLLHELRRVLSGRPFRRAARPAATTLRLRRAS